MFNKRYFRLFHGSKNRLSSLNGIAQYYHFITESFVLTLCYKTPQKCYHIRSLKLQIR